MRNGANRFCGTLSVGLGGVVYSLYYYVMRLVCSDLFHYLRAV